MKTLTVNDIDGAPYYIAAESDDAARAFEAQHRRRAIAYGCNMREIPDLGSTSPGPFHRAFKVTRNEAGAITSIDYKRHGTAARFMRSPSE